MALSNRFVFVSSVNWSYSFYFLENLAIFEINSWQFSLLLEFSYSSANLLIHVAMVLLFIDQRPLMSKSFELVEEGGTSEQ